MVKCDLCPRLGYQYIFWGEERIVLCESCLDWRWLRKSLEGKRYAVMFVKALKLQRQWQHPNTKKGAGGND